MIKIVGGLVATLTLLGASATSAKSSFWIPTPGHSPALTAPIPIKSKAGHCPPGLAKKAVPCVPPGQAKRYRVGDHIYGGYKPINNPSRWGLRRNGYYVQAGDYVYEINRETHEVLNLIGAIADILN